MIQHSIRVPTASFTCDEVGIKIFRCDSLTDMSNTSSTLLTLCACVCVCYANQVITESIKRLDRVKCSDNYRSVHASGK